VGLDHPFHRAVKLPTEGGEGASPGYSAAALVDRLHSRTSLIDRERDRVNVHATVVMLSIPQELLDAARVDGASEYGVFFR
jgi:hypothetical protein